MKTLMLPKFVVEDETVNLSKIFPWVRAMGKKSDGDYMLFESLSEFREWEDKQTADTRGKK